jgi:predicted secreted Zn-dependent protease
MGDDSNLDALVPETLDQHRDPRAAAREARAKNYFDHDLEDLRRWYSKHAGRFRSRARALGIAVVAAGAATTFLQVFRDAPWVPVLTALLGALVAPAGG